MVDLVFEDPPDPGARIYRPEYDVKKNADREEIVAALPRHPGRWAIVSRHTSRVRAGQVARVLRERYPAPYEFRTAVNPTGEGVVYGRYTASDANI